MPRATVIVPARDAQDTLPRTLQALGRQELAGGFEVIVVDNGSVDGTAEVAAGSPTVGRVIRRPRGEGPGAARNAGAAESRGEVLVFLDADCWPATDWLASGVSTITDLDLAQGRVMPDPDAQLGPFDRTLVVGAAHGLFETANLFVRRELFEQLAGFSVGLEDARAGKAQDASPFGEDVIFGWRARRAGARTGFCDEALVYHEVFSRGPGSFIAERARLALFPALAAQVPELRDVFFHRRFFLSNRSARFDLALAGVALALIADEPLLLGAAAPYLRLLAKTARRTGSRRAPLVAAAEAAADAVGALALLRGSVESKSLLL
jgi:cellulose synthase/poly-beta-1,6-N-acetylglucosamine synthase-like glycosyltransferase